MLGFDTGLYNEHSRTGARFCMRTSSRDFFDAKQKGDKRNKRWCSVSQSSFLYLRSLAEHKRPCRVYRQTSASYKPR